MDEMATDVILDALNRAAAAHGIYEAEVLGGRHDDEWPEWYAEHMIGTLADLGYRVVGPGLEHI